LVIEQIILTAAFTADLTPGRRLKIIEKNLPKDLVPIDILLIFIYRNLKIDKL